MFWILLKLLFGGMIQNMNILARYSGISETYCIGIPVNVDDAKKMLTVSSRTIGVLVILCWGLET